MAADIPAKFRLVVSDAQLSTKKLVFQSHTNLCGSAVDKRQKPFVPLSPPWVKKDSKIALEVCPTSLDDKTVDYDAGAGATELLLDATERLPNGKMIPLNLTLDDFEFTSATGIAHADVILGKIGVWIVLGYYTVPAGMRVAIGRHADGYAYLKIKSTG